MVAWIKNDQCDVFCTKCWIHTTTAWNHLPSSKKLFNFQSYRNIVLWTLKLTIKFACTVTLHVNPLIFITSHRIGPVPPVCCAGSAPPRWPGRLLRPCWLLSYHDNRLSQFPGGGRMTVPEFVSVSLWTNSTESSSVSALVDVLESQLSLLSVFKELKYETPESESKRFRVWPLQESPKSSNSWASRKVFLTTTFMCEETVAVMPLSMWLC